MDNIVNFPTKTVRNKIAFDRALKDVLEKYPIESTAKDDLRQRLVSIWEKYQFEFPLQFSLPLPSSITQSEIDSIHSSLKQTIQGFQNFFDGFIHDRLLEHCHLELKLFLDDHPLPPQTK